MSPPSLQALQRGVRSDGWLEDDAPSLSLWRFAARPQPTPDCIGAVRPVRIASALEEAMVWSRRRMIRSGSLIALALAAQIMAVRADQRDDFLAGRTRDCPRCDLAGA